MLDSKTHKALAKELNDSEKSHVQVEHFTRRFPEITLEDGYKIQLEWMELKKKEGLKVIGHKIGLTSRAMQMASQVNEPDFGTLMDDMVYHENGDIPFSRFIVPRVEVELGFVMKKRLEGNKTTLFDVLNAVDYVQPSLEIIDARIEQQCRHTSKFRRVQDTISDNAANAGIVMGGLPVRVDDVDLRWVSAMMSVNGQIEETGVAAGVMNHPAKSIAWLVNKLSEFGQGLEAGEVILSGSFTRPVFAKKGDVISADYGKLGTVAFAFV